MNKQKLCLRQIKGEIERRKERQREEREGRERGRKSGRERERKRESQRERERIMYPAPVSIYKYLYTDTCFHIFISLIM